MTKPYVLQEIDNLKTSVEDVRKAKNIGIEDTAGVFTSENVEDALKEIKDLIGDGLDVEVTASEVTTESGSNVQDEIDSLKLSVSSGKTNIRNALTGKGLTVADADEDGIPTHAEIVSSINTPDLVRTNSADAISNQIRDGKTAFVNGAKITGTLPVRSTETETITPGISNIVKSAGIYDGDLTILGDPDLVSANIKAGVSIFGITGKASVVDTADANGEEWTILSGYTGYVNGTKVSGAMKDNGPGTTITPGVNNIMLSDGYWDSTNVIMGDPDLISSNIKAGVTIFGVTGNSNVVDTSPGTAIADDILSTKIAFVDGVQVTGTMPNQTGEYGAVDYYWWEPDKNLYFKVPKGYYPGGTTGNWTNGGNIYVNEPDLISANIRSGVSIFGISGKTEVVDTTESTAPATAGYILNGRVGFVNGVKQIGAMLNKSGEGLSTSWTNTLGDAYVEVPIPENGYYNTASWLQINDPDLVSANIKSGTNIFGVSGDPNVIDTSNALPAANSDILTGREAFVNGVKMVGSMVDNGAGSVRTPTTTDQILAAGYWSSVNTVKGDTNLVSANIRSGITIFGIPGNANVVNTVDGTASAGEIIVGKTAYVSGSKITGTMPNNGAGSIITPGTTNQTVAAGYWATSTTVLGDADLVASNIPNDTTIFGVTGNLERFTNTNKLDVINAVNGILGM